MPRNRNVRVAVLGSSVQRAAPSGHSSTRSGPLKRRFVVVGLVLVSLVLLTVSFRSTALDPVEGFGASVLRPFEVAASRIARPFRDASSYAHGLFNAKAQNRRYRAEISQLERRNAELTGAEEDDTNLRQELHYVHSATFPQDYTEIGARVLSSPSVLDQSITIAAGSHNGIALEDVVVTQQGLVGTVTKLVGDEARVTLITDPNENVRAVDQVSPAAVGILDHGAGTTSLILDGIGDDKHVATGDTVITAGSPVGGKLQSLYPRGIAIGQISSAIQNDTDIDWNIQVQPFVDFSSLESVLVLIPKPKKATG